MKLSLYLVVAVAVAWVQAAPLAAQVSVGGTGYAHALSLSGDYPVDQSISTQVGYGVGAALAYRVSQEFELTLEPAIDVRRGVINDTVATIRIRSFAMPVGVRIWSHAQTWVFTSGVIVRLAPDAERVASDGTTMSLASAFAHIELGVFLGAGYQLQVGGARIVPEIRYEQGISNVLSGEAVSGLPPAPILRTNGFSFRVACQFALGGAR